MEGAKGAGMAAGRVPIARRLFEAKVVRHSKHALFHLAEVAVPRPLFAAIRQRIGQMRSACASG
jgi:hypothetical protein